MNVSGWTATILYAGGLGLAIVGWSNRPVLIAGWFVILTISVALTVFGSD